MDLDMRINIPFPLKYYWLLILKLINLEKITVYIYSQIYYTRGFLNLVQQNISHTKNAYFLCCWVMQL